MVLDDGGLAVFVLGFRFGDQRRNVGGRGVSLGVAAGCCACACSPPAVAAIVKAKVATIVRMETSGFRFELRCYHNEFETGPEVMGSQRVNR